MYGLILPTARDSIALLIVMVLLNWYYSVSAFSGELAFTHRFRKLPLRVIFCTTFCIKTTFDVAIGYCIELQ